MPNHPPSAISHPDSCDVSAARLPHPVRLTEQTWPEGTAPVVSVLCITYNHEKFIRDAIEGFLMQETTFPVEIFVHDDASTDGTTEVVKEYAAKYPELFWTVFQTENQWSKGNKKILFDYLAQQRGEFIALCEGDDYWTSPGKLQQQAELLWADRTVSLVGHLTDIVDTNGLPTGEAAMPAVPWPPRVGLSEYFRQGYFGFHVSSWLFRREFLQGAEWINNLGVGDVPLMIHLASRGDVLFVPECMSAYRRHDSSYWASNPGAWQARVSVKVYSAAAARLEGESRSLARQTACSLRFRLAEMLYAEGKTAHAVLELVRYAVEKALLRENDFDLPCLETVVRRMKQMLLGRRDNESRVA